MSGEEAYVKLAKILVDFSGEVGGLPSLREFFELLEWSSEDIYSTSLTFEATLRGGTVYSGIEGSRVPELSDAIFSDVTDILAGLSGEEGGEPMSLSDLADFLLPFINYEAENLLDISGGDVSGLSVAAPDRIAAPPKVGDVLAIPADGAWYAAIVLARNRFGVAFGIFREKFQSITSVDPRSSAVCPFPVYSDDMQVVNGSWQVVGHDEELLSVFPVEPEIYHSANPAWLNHEFGEFGAAETAAGNIRLIDDREARAVGITNDSYRQSYPSDFLQRSLGGLAIR
ncbi:hypothetical protein [Streptomyces fructofermentans]|uniref:hypothetical protein n=1 Tax=Streptomyces fructofermentans TaxID=152141 RepID=UPI003789A469